MFLLEQRSAPFHESRLFFFWTQDSLEGAASHMAWFLGCFGKMYEKCVLGKGKEEEGEGFLYDGSLEVGDEMRVSDET
jgi:hypothetical protein